MKHFVRVETASGLAQVPADRLPTRVKIVHQGSGQDVLLPLTWTAGGRSALTTWNIPPAAKLGVYESCSSASARPAAAQRATSEGGRERRWTSGNFRVEEFRLPLVDARERPQDAADRRRERQRRRADELLLGRRDGVGGAARLGAAEEPRDRFPGYDEFSFEPARDPVSRKHPRATRARPTPAAATASSSLTRCRW
jgi:hypothetical protein